MKSHINLLPQENRRRLMLRLRVKQWLLILCAVFATGTAYAWAGYREHLAIQKNLDIHHRTYKPITMLKQELNTMKEKAAILDQREALATFLVDRHPALTLLAQVAQSASQCRGRLQINELKLGKPGEKGLERPLESSNETHVVLIKGTALDIPTVTRFVDALRGANLFTQVDMKPTMETTISNQPVYNYHVACAYQ
ncbi:MAG: hypothetical protein JW829_08540 [Pirellulales bacterium]|nr:hypothetical protein [Pirellulales bacterium]